MLEWVLYVFCSLLYKTDCKDLYLNFDVARKRFESVNESLQLPLSKLMFNGDPNTLNRTEFAQPAILTHSIAALDVVEVRAPSQRCLD